MSSQLLSIKWIVAAKYETLATEVQWSQVIEKYIPANAVTRVALTNAAVLDISVVTQALENISTFGFKALHIARKYEFSQVETG